MHLKKASSPVGLKVGDCVAELSFGTFSEWGIVSEKLAMPVPTCSPEIVALLTSGLTASIGERECVEPRLLRYNSKLQIFLYTCL